MPGNRLVANEAVAFAWPLITRSSLIGELSLLKQRDKTFLLRAPYCCLVLVVGKSGSLSHFPPHWISSLSLNLPLFTVRFATCSVATLIEGKVRIQPVSFSQKNLIISQSFSEWSYFINKTSEGVVAADKESLKAKINSYGFYFFLNIQC